MNSEAEKNIRSNILDGNSNESSGDWGIFDGNVSQALQSYLRELGKLPKMTADELYALGQRILTVENRWRDWVNSFVFTAQFELEYFSGKDPAVFLEQFMPSSVMDGTTADDIIKSLKQIEMLLPVLASAYQDGNQKEVCELRKKLSGEMSRYKLSGDILMDCYEKLKLAWNSMNSESAAIFAEDSCMTVEEFTGNLAQAELALTELLELRQQMVEGNLRLVLRIVNQYSYRQVSVSDLVQEGNLGLMRSLEKFDFNLKHKFSTYASWWIRQSIGRAIAEQFRVIRIPAHMVSTIAAINRVEQRFIMEHDRLPESDEIAALLEMPVARVSAIRQMARQPISLQSPLGSDSTGNSLEDLLPDERTVDPAQDVAEESAQEQLLKLLSKLTDRERDVLTMRFGLMGHPVCTLQEISKHFNISRERVRQLEMQTLNKLRSQETLRFFDKNNLD